VGHGRFAVCDFRSIQPSRGVPTGITRRNPSGGARRPQFGRFRSVLQNTNIQTDITVNEPTGDRDNSMPRPAYRLLPNYGEMNLQFVSK
jgi:hypothetical protein